MKNTLHYALIALGLLLIGLGGFALLFPRFLTDTIFQEAGQSIAMILFGGLCLLGGMAYKRR